MLNKIGLSGMMLLAMIVVLVGGCSSGGSTGNGGGTQKPAAAAVTATVKIAAAGTLPTNSTIGGVDLALTLPAGVTVKASPGSLSALVPDAGIVTASGAAAANSRVYAVYTAGAGAAPGTVRILLANTAGFSTGEFVTVKCDIASGSTPTTADFSASGIKFVDGNGKLVDGLTTTVTADFQ